MLKENILFPYLLTVIYFTELSLYSVFWNSIAANTNSICLPLADLLG